MILSLQGCMAVGKTTALRYIKDELPDINVSYDMNSDIISEIRNRQLNKNEFHDYIEIQKLWINKEIKRYQDSLKYQCTVMDFGAEEIEFYTLNYPKSIGMKWDIESALNYELSQLRKCLPTRILFLDASEDVLRIRKENDNTRTRNFFEYHLKYLLPLKRDWFFSKDNVDVLCVDDLSIDEVVISVKEWIDDCLLHYQCRL